MAGRQGALPARPSGRDAELAALAAENERLRTEVVRRTEEQAATAALLEVIGRSSDDVTSALRAIAGAAMRLVGADGTAIWRVEPGGATMRFAANADEFGAQFMGTVHPIIPESVPGRAILERRVVHVPDVAAAGEEFPFSAASSMNRTAGLRTMLAVPLLRDGQSIGAFSIVRRAVVPFEPAQIELATTFAAQAVIAIENARLFDELQARLGEQTAIAEVLRVISAAPVDFDRVVATIAEAAARTAGAPSAALWLREGEHVRVLGRYVGADPATQARAGERPLGVTHPLDAAHPVARAILERRTLHIPDFEAVLDEFSAAASRVNRVLYRSAVSVPLMRGDDAIGALAIGRPEAGPFAPRQIQLAELFADQAVIAIENARLFDELNRTNASLRTALEQQTATARVLETISRSPTNLQRVLDTICESAGRLAGGMYTTLSRVDGEDLVNVAQYVPSELAPLFGTPPERIQLGKRVPLSAWTYRTYAVRDRRTYFIPDLLETNGPNEAGAALGRERDVRCYAAVPLLRGDVAIGTLAVAAPEPRALDEPGVRLLETFADQAVIAIENARLFAELQERLTEETAIAEVLRVISESPTSLDVVMEAVVSTGVRLAGADTGTVWRFDGEVYRWVAEYPRRRDSAGFVAYSLERPPRLETNSALGVAGRELRTVHVPDVLADDRFDYWHLSKNGILRFRTVLAVPFVHDGTLRGAIVIDRTEPRPFTPREIALIETFAHQAAIAMENARLFQELQERLEEQTATAEVLRVIAGAPTDLEGVLDAIGAAAVRLCGAAGGTVRLIEGAMLRVAGASDEATRRLVGYVSAFDRYSTFGRAIIERRVVHVADIRDDGDEFPTSSDAASRSQFGPRTVLVIPLLRGDEVLGAIGLRRSEVRPFSDQQIRLLQSFADQAVIAIENARLFHALEDRTRQLGQSVEQLTALADVSQAISSTLDVQAVLTAVVERAVALSGTHGGSIYGYNPDTQTFDLRATHGMSPDLIEAVREYRIHLGDTIIGRTAAERRAIQTPDLLLADPARNPLAQRMVEAGFRALLAVPLIREQEIVGALVVRRREPGQFPEGTVELLQTFANQSALAIQNARLFAELAEKSAQLEEASRHKSAFLANMSHELRTPLNAILGYTELIADGIYGDMPERAREPLDRVQKSGQHLLGLINAVLDLSKIEAGQLVLSVEPYSLPELVAAACAQVETLAAEKGLRLVADVAADLPPGRGDPRRLTQVVLNLLGNAVKFTEAGAVTVRAAAADGCFVVSVADTGPGIAAGDQARIFEEFQQASAGTRQQGGTGLGLAIARRIVEGHGGRIRVESAPGAGATFTFTVPLEAEVAV